MSPTQKIYAAAALLAALGLWLMLPRAGRATGRVARAIGAVFAAIGLGLFAAQIPRFGDRLDSGVFFLLAAITIVSAAATISFRNPVYCAIWFAITLLGTAGLFFYQGAQFLGVATVVVYAGAILVTFLFVLMLANPSGHAYYDRLSWEAWLAAPAGAVMVALLTLNIARAFNRQSVRAIDAAARARDILAAEHVAHLGRNLFSQYLIGVEVAGTLLLVALVGAVAIVAHEKQSPRVATRRQEGPRDE